MRGLRGILVAVAALASTPAWAGNLYRCDSPDGTRAYASKRVAGAKCTVISYQPEKHSRAAAAAPAVATGAGTGVGTASPAMTVTGSPATVTPKPVGDASMKARFVRMGSSLTYSYIDANGVRNYSNRRPKGVANVKVSRVEFPIFQIENCYACGALPGVNFGNIRLNTTAYNAEIASSAAQFGVEEAIVRAIIHAESSYNPGALSRVGAQGLMQLMPATARRFGVTNAFDPAQNIRGGVQYLGWLLKRFNGDVKLAAAGYNAGEGAVDKYKGVPPYAETQRYVQRVAVLADRYRGAGGKTTVAATGAGAGSR
ncbi:lytic transglycosylase domain-containing protein [Agrilutibacter niabensis]|uniref:lytic transglycosylase domain-containing protein n=1 Tax=Agrilutibacter niabensis TaxID=380628 RepID=UPI00286C5D57|nr:lytic transglycosylase domain-containing protein [Lysobacter niabensis]